MKDESDAQRQVVQVTLSPKIALAVGTLATIFCAENTFCMMDVENTPSPTTAAGELTTLERERERARAVGMPVSSQAICRCL